MRRGCLCRGQSLSAVRRLFAAVPTTPTLVLDPIATATHPRPLVRFAHSRHTQSPLTRARQAATTATCTGACEVTCLVSRRGAAGAASRALTRRRAARRRGRAEVAREVTRELTRESSHGSSRGSSHGSSHGSYAQVSETQVSFPRVTQGGVPFFPTGPLFWNKRRKGILK